MAVMSQSNELTPKNAELLHHYVTAASSSLADYDSFRPVWQVSVPQEAQSFGFLMDGILAISALHLGSLYYSPAFTSCERQALPYHELAHRHYDAAVSCFNTGVKQLTPANTNAVLAFAHLSVYFAFGSSPALPSAFVSLDHDTNKTVTEQPIDDLLEVILLFRKAMAVLRTAWSLLADSTMSILLQHGPEVTDSAYLPTDIRIALEQLGALILSQQSQHNPELELPSNVYICSYAWLLSSFVMAETRPSDWSISLRFPMNVPEALIGQIRSREPLALVILAHYCVLLHRAPVRWWAVGWGSKVLKAVCHCLTGKEPVWTEHIAWCTAAVGV
jgi:hypothetical protein